MLLGGGMTRLSQECGAEWELPSEGVTQLRREVLPKKGCPEGCPQFSEHLLGVTWQGDAPIVSGMLRREEITQLRQEVLLKKGCPEDCPRLVSIYQLLLGGGMPRLS